MDANAAAGSDAAQPAAGQGDLASYDIGRIMDAIPHR